MLRIILNILWILLGGLELAIGWFLVGLLFAVTIIGLPWARAAFNMGIFALWPFGSEAVDREILYGREDVGTSELGMLGNIIWFVLAGWWLALGHIFAAIICAITIIGIPFAIQHVKLAGMALFPIGKAIISREEAVRLRA